MQFQPSRVHIQRNSAMGGSSSIEYVSFSTVTSAGIARSTDLPHCVREDDVYNEMLIPKGSIVSLHICTTFDKISKSSLAQVIANIW